MAVLDERVASLKFDLQLAQSRYQALEAALNEVQGLRKAMTALPKRQSRAKPRAVAPSGNAETKATAA